MQLGKSESLLSKLEQGERELKDLRLARAIAELSGVRVVWLLGLDDGPPVKAESASRPMTAPARRQALDRLTDRLTEEELAEMLRRTFVLGGLATTLDTGTLRLGTAGANTSVPAVSPETVADLAAVSASYRRAYSSVPAAQLYRAAHEHLSLVLSLRPGDQPAAIRKELLITAGEMANLAGGLLHSNLRRFDEAGQYLKLAYDAAREAGDADLETDVLGIRSWLAHNIGDRRSALEFAEVAVTAGRQGAHPATHGYVAATAAVRHADLGDDLATGRRLEDARRALTVDAEGIRWSGFGLFDSAKVISYEGSTLLALGRHQQAVTVLGDALDQIDPTRHRSRAWALIDRAEAHLAGGNIDAACADAGAALDLAAHTGHLGCITRLEPLARAALPTRSTAARQLWQDVLAAKATQLTVG